MLTMIGGGVFQGPCENVRVIRPILAAMVALLVVASPAMAVPTPAPDVASVVSGAGQSMYLECAGEHAKKKDPTIVLIPGLGATHTYFRSVFRSLATSSRVCSYDRPGLGKSPARIGSRVVNAELHADELLAGLAAVGESGPFLVVGHSYGGLLAREFAVRAPDAVTGMVLIDPSYSTQWQTDVRYWREGKSKIDMKAVQDEVFGKPELGKKPLLVITAGKGSSKGWHAEQQRMVKFSSNAYRVIVKNASHVIFATNPSAVVAGVTQVLESVRSDEPLPGCTDPMVAMWAAMFTRCVG